MKQAVVCSLFGKLRDRFREYGEDLSLTERLARIGRIPELDGVEIVFPRDLQDLDGLAATLAGHDLGVAAINVNIKSDPLFVAGALTSPDAAVRRKAVDYIKRGKEWPVPSAPNGSPAVRSPMATTTHSRLAMAPLGTA